MKLHHGAATTRRTIMILIVSAGVTVTGLTTLTGRARYSRLFSATTNYNGDYMEKREPIPHRRRIPQAPASIYQNPPKKGVVGSSLGILKKGVFGTFDVVSSIISKINDKKSGEETYIESGYLDMVENASAGMVFSSEETKLKRQYEALEREKVVLASSTPSSFDDAKTGFYSTIDGVGKLLTPSKDTSNPSKSTPIVASSPSQNNDPYTLEMQRLLPQRNDPNPFTRLSTAYRLQSLQIAKTRHDARRRSDEALTLAKSTVYGTLDALTTTARFLSTATTRTQAAFADVQRQAQSLPDDIDNAREILETVVDDVKSLPTVVSQKIDDVKSIPTKVETTMNGVRQSVNDVRRSVDSTRTRAAATIQTIRDIPQTVDDIAFNVKIATGLERKPVRPPTTKEKVDSLAWKIAKTTGRMAWDATRGTVTLGYRGAKWGVGKAWVAVQMRRGRERAEKEMTAADVAVRRIEERRKRIETVADVDADLGREVAEALKGAEAVLSQSSSETMMTTKAKGVYLDEFGEDYEMKESIDEALKIAKITAKKVKEDSEAVQRAYNQTRY